MSKWLHTLLGSHVGSSTVASQELCKAAMTGNKAMVVEQLAKGADTDYSDENGFTVLYYSCANGHTEVATLLLDRGAAVDRARDEHGRTALMVSCVKGHTEAAALLLDRGLPLTTPTIKARRRS